MRAAFLLIGLLIAASAAPSAQAASFLRVTLVVADMEKSILFYERLGLAKVHDEARTGTSQVHGVDELPLTADPTRSRIVIMKGDGPASEIALLWYDRPPLASARGNLMGLGTGDIIVGITVPDLQNAFVALDRIGARLERGPNRFINAPMGPRLYAYDPDGHLVELTQGVR